MRTFQYTFTVTCAGNGTADTAQVEALIDLSMQDLVYDDEFILSIGTNPLWDSRNQIT